MKKNQIEKNRYISGFESEAKYKKKDKAKLKVMSKNAHMQKKYPNPRPDHTKPDHLMSRQLRFPSWEYRIPYPLIHPLAISARWQYSQRHHHKVVTKGKKIVVKSQIWLNKAKREKRKKKTTLCNNYHNHMSRLFQFLQLLSHHTPHPRKLFKTTPPPRPEPSRSHTSYTWQTGIHPCTPTYSQMDPFRKTYNFPQRRFRPFPSLASFCASGW